MSSFAAYVVNSAAFTVGIIFIAMYNNYVLSLFHYKKKINAYCIISYSVIIIAILFVWTNPLQIYISMWMRQELFGQVWQETL